jgi:hypothetical protein
LHGPDKEDFTYLYNIQEKHLSGNLEIEALCTCCYIFTKKNNASPFALNITQTILKDIEAQYRLPYNHFTFLVEQKIRTLSVQYADYPPLETSLQQTLMSLQKLDVQ